MKCPLIHYKEPNPDVFPCEVFEDCLQEECAVWDEKHECCSERTKRVQLERIADILSNIAKELTLIRK